MKTIGLDIGTTTVCGVLVDGNTGCLIQARTLPNDAALPSAYAWERKQNPQRLEAICRDLIHHFTAVNEDIAGIGISNQMHGILYVDAIGHALSPLYTWQDESGNQPFVPDMSFADRLRSQTGHAMATGYGLTTHWYHLQKGLVPTGAAKLCTIGDYIAMRLTSSTTPRIHTTNAASLGLFSLATGEFDPVALHAADIGIDILPQVSQIVECVGQTPEGIPVSLAIGDNQAGFFGSGSNHDTIFVNVGTSGQVSMLTNDLSQSTSIDVRPYLGKQRLAVGCSLCGGDAYATLKKFYERTASLFGMQFEPMYDTMNAAATTLYSTSDRLAGFAVDTRLRGTRANASQRGSITGLGMDTFTPEHLNLGVLIGICDELYNLSAQIPCLSQAQRLVGSGNGLRKNPLLRRIFSDTFEMPMRVPLYEEEAAYGVALLALHTFGVYTTPEAAQALIPYLKAD